MTLRALYVIFNSTILCTISGVWNKIIFLDTNVVQKTWFYSKKNIFGLEFAPMSSLCPRVDLYCNCYDKTYKQLENI